jgi:CubicO group peptidase (beta-lactamase class C family)
MRLPAVAQMALDRLAYVHIGPIFPAAALTVVYRDEVLFNGAWGWIDPDRCALPVQPDTLFDLASVTKLFTVTAFLALVSAGCVELDEPIVSVLPEFGHLTPRAIDGGQDPHSKVFLPTPDEWIGRTADPAQVTFRHLLTHTSGLAPWRDVFRAAGPPPPSPDTPDPSGGPSAGRGHWTHCGIIRLWANRAAASVTATWG